MSVYLGNQKVGIVDLQTAPVTPEPWVRPAGWPDYSQIPNLDNWIYATYDTQLYDDWKFNFVSIYFVNAVAVEMGYLSNGTFTAISTQAVAAGSYYRTTIPDTVTERYVVVRWKPTGSALTRWYFAISAGIENAFTISYAYQPCVEVYGQPKGETSMQGSTSTARVTRYMQSYTMFGTINVTNMAYAFYGGISLKNIKIDGLNTSKCTSFSNTFYDCRLLQTIPQISVTNKCTTIQNAFTNCYSLMSLNTSSWDTTNITSLASTFSACYNLPEIDVSSWNVAKVTTMASTFNLCQSVKELDVSGWRTSLCANFSSTFSGCYLVKELDVSNWDTAKSTTMASMFANTRKLKNVDVSGFDTALTTTVASMFSGCLELQSVDCHGWDMRECTTVANMFQNCYKLQYVNVSNWNLAKCTTAASIFSGCHQLPAITGLTTWSTTNKLTTIASFALSCGRLRELDLSSLDLSSVTAAGAATVCRYDYTLIKVVLPASLAYIGSNFAGSSTMIMEYHLQGNSVKELSAVAAIGYNDYTRIYVPASYITYYQAAENWSSSALVHKFAGE